MPGFFDAGHGFLSSTDEWMVALVAFVLVTIIGAIAAVAVAIPIIVISYAYRRRDG